MSDVNIKYSNTKIGVFDSGVGGLSILKVLEREMPCDDFIYFGDTKNVPYGSKKKEEIIQFGRNTINFFITHGVKNIVIACNTSSALAYDTLKSEFPEVEIFPIIDMVAKDIAQYSKVAVFATIATVKSGRYKREISKHNPLTEVFEVPCQEFVKIVENSLYNDENCVEYIYKILMETLSIEPDKIILGCTHYPYLLPILTNWADKKIFIDPAKIFASSIKNELGVGKKSTHQGKSEFWVSAEPDAFKKNAKVFYKIEKAVNLIP